VFYHHHHHGRVAGEGRRVVAPPCPRSTARLRSSPVGRVESFRLVVLYTSCELRRRVADRVQSVKYHARLHSAYTDDDAMQCNTIDVVISYFFTIDVVPGSRKMQNMTFICRTEMLLIGPTIVSRRRNFLYRAQHSHNVVVRNLATAML